MEPPHRSAAEVDGTDRGEVDPVTRRMRDLCAGRVDSDMRVLAVGGTSVDALPGERDSACGMLVAVSCREADGPFPAGADLVVRHDGPRLPFADDTFDRVVWDARHGTADVTQALAEMSRVLCAGGVLVLALPARTIVTSLSLLVRSRSARAGVRPERGGSIGARAATGWVSRRDLLHHAAIAGLDVGWIDVVSTRFLAPTGRGRGSVRKDRALVASLRRRVHWYGATGRAPLRLRCPYCARTFPAERARVILCSECGRSLRVEHRRPDGASYARDAY